VSYAKCYGSMSFESSELCDTLARLCADRCASVRFHAVLGLRNQRNSLTGNARAALLRALGDEDVEIARAALGAIQWMKRPPDEFVAAVLKIANDETATLRTDALAVMLNFRIPTERVWPAVQKALNSESTSHVAARLLKLMDCDNPKVVEKLIELVKNDSCCFEAIDAITYSPRRSQMAQAGLVAEFRRRAKIDKDRVYMSYIILALGAVPEPGADAIGFLNDLLDDDDLSIRIAAATAACCLGIKSKKAIVILANDLNKDENGRTTSCLLRGHDSVLLEPIVLALLHDKAESVRWRVLSALTSKSKLSKRVLLEIAQLAGRSTRLRDVQMHALVILFKNGAISEHVFYGILLSCMQSRSDRVRHAAMDCVETFVPHLQLSERSIKQLLKLETDVLVSRQLLLHWQRLQLCRN